jgi:TolB-like protein
VVPVPVPKKSIAVLPFSDLSPTHDQEYFSDGMSEEILNALAKIKDLKVAGRTSAFSFKGKNEDLRTVGKALAVAHVLEGSVRKQGDQVRITAQLIQAEDGYHLWSDTYDGDLKNVFALQERIARAIAEQLELVLGGGQQQQPLVAVATGNSDAYALYLQATAIFNRREGSQYAEAIKALEQAVKLDPDYARAYSRLAALYTSSATFAGSNVAAAHEHVFQYAARAIALDPSLAEAHAAEGYAWSRVRGRLLEERAAFERALQANPNDTTSLFWFGLALSMSGYRQEAMATLDHALTIDPMLPNLVRWRAILAQQDGELARAETALKLARDLDLRVADYNLAEHAYARGDVDGAVRLWSQGAQGLMFGVPAASVEAIARGIYGDAAARTRAVAVIEQECARQDQVLALMPSALIRLGQPKRAFELLRDRQNTDLADSLTMLWAPQQKAMRATPEFAQFVRDYGFPALWDKYGPPDACRRDAQGNYSCG